MTPENPGVLHQSDAPISGFLALALRTFTVGLQIGLITVAVGWPTFASAHEEGTGSPPAGSLVRTDQLHGHGTIYLVQLGPHKDTYSVDELAKWLGQKYSVNVQVLDASTLDAAAGDSSRHRYVAEHLIEQMKREHPVLAADPNCWMIGFTDAEIYSGGDKQFSLRGDPRAAIISSASMNDPGVLNGLRHALHPGKANATERMRRILLKDVAVLYWHLPMNFEDQSVLNRVLDPDLPWSDLYESDLDPAQSEGGEFVGDPCIIFNYSAQAGSKVSVQGGRLIRQCDYPEALDTPDSPRDVSEERMEINLEHGSLQERHTDFFLPGRIPIRFERANGVEWLEMSSFGMNGGHNFDRYLGSDDRMRHIWVASPAGTREDLERVPEEVADLAVNKWVDTVGFGNSIELRWREGPDGHFDLTRYTGEVESYLPCTDSERCLLNGYRNKDGDTLVIKRDDLRRLMSLSAPNENWLHFRYEGSTDRPCTNCIAEIRDSQGRIVLYGYDSQARLEKITYP